MSFTKTSLLIIKICTGLEQMLIINNLNFYFVMSDNLHFSKPYVVLIVFILVSSLGGKRFCQQ